MACLCLVLNLCSDESVDLILFSDVNRKNGYPAITDDIFVLGRILPEFFPSIFGEDEKQPLDAGASKSALHKIAEQVNEQARSSGQPEKTVEEVWSVRPTLVTLLQAYHDWSAY